MLTLASALLTLQVTGDARSMTGGLPLPAILAEARELWQPYFWTSSSAPRRIS
jgi:hypothetical protein